MWKTIKNAALPEVVVVGRSSIDSLCEEKNQYEKNLFPFPTYFFCGAIYDAERNERN